MSYSEQKILQIIEALKELEQDTCVPKNVKERVSSTIRLLQGNVEASIRVNQALQELEEITEDNNMEPYTRSQIFNIVSLLEVV